MTKTAPSAIVTGTAIVALISVLFGDSAAPVWKQGEWLRLAITAIALLIGGYVVWKNRTEIALQDSVSALRTAVEAHKIESDALALSLKRVTEEKIKLEAECVALKAKTDVGEVLKMLTALTASTNSQLRKNEGILHEIQQKVNGWKSDRRDALRRDDEDRGGSRRRATPSGHYGSFKSPSADESRSGSADDERDR